MLLEIEYVFRTPRVFAVYQHPICIMPTYKTQPHLNNSNLIVRVFTPTHSRKSLLSVWNSIRTYKQRSCAAHIVIYTKSFISVPLGKEKKRIYDDGLSCYVILDRVTKFIIPWTIFFCCYNNILN